MQVSHENRVPCTTLQCSYNAARTSWLSGGYRVCQWVGQCNGEVDRVDHSWPDSSRVERFGESRVDRSSRAQIAADRSFWSTRSILGSSGIVGHAAVRPTIYGVLAINQSIKTQKSKHICIVPYVANESEASIITIGLSCMITEIWRLKDFGVTILTF